MTSYEKFSEQDHLNITAVRMLSVDQIEKANSGHPGLPLGTAPAVYALWSRILRHNPANPQWPDRDRFVLSPGHGSPLLYSLLNLFGYDLPIDELKRFRQYGSKTPGHPEQGHTAGVETTTGPLGQGVSNAVGMALAERFLAGHFNEPDFPIINHHTYALVGDGDLMEGISHEALSFAGQQKLNKLICLFDDNNITIEGKATLACADDAEMRFKSYGWNVLRVYDGNDAAAIAAALEQARASQDKPTVIIMKTHIGNGSPRQDTPSAHGEPLGEKNWRATREFYKWTEPQFEIPEEIRNSFAEIAASRAREEEKWHALFDAYTRKFPAKAEEFRQWLDGKLPSAWWQAVPLFAGKEGAMASRESGGKVLNAIADVLPNLIGGSADLAPSTKTALTKYPERTLHFGIREHAMGAIVNGMALHGGVIPFSSTFFVFTDYMRPAMRMAALMGTHSIFVFTHDSIGVGEDGPTHQAVEHLSAMRAMPRMTLLRPGDANETAAAWISAIQHKGPSCIVLTRQKLELLDCDPQYVRDSAARGAYVTHAPASGKPEVVIIGTGSEAKVAQLAAQKLCGEGVNASSVSMPSFELFRAQDKRYRDGVLPPGVKRVAVEAGTSMCWREFVGEDGAFVCVEDYGVSAPYSEVFKHFGITVDNVADKARKLVRG